MARRCTASTSTAEFNASIRQLPRFGLFGGAVNHLSIGLPLLMALDRRRLLSVLAHEYGHLRGNHGQAERLDLPHRGCHGHAGRQLPARDEGVMAFASQAFFRWYFPRFAAKTFALARQDEYEADRVGGPPAGHAGGGRRPDRDRGQERLVCRDLLAGALGARGRRADPGRPLLRPWHRS